MSLHALATGTLFRTPELKVSKSGKNFVSTTLKTKSGDAIDFINVLVFSESQGAEMLRLAAGDSVPVQGTLKAELVTKRTAFRGLAHDLRRQHLGAAPGAPRAQIQSRPAPARMP